VLIGLVVVRHASARQSPGQSYGDWRGSLDDLGLSQSCRLVTGLADIALDRIYSSPAPSCRDTVAALAGLRRLPVTVAPWLATGTSGATVASGVALLSGVVLLCTHDEVAGLVRAALHDRYGLPLDPHQALDPGGTWTFRFEGGRVARSCHLPGPGPAAARRPQQAARGEERQPASVDGRADQAL
jgi:phosphohistidine phosphatase SixA